ncbi:MAG: alpha-1,4-glucan--maltose-1-phosphate maltosyltransferase [Candidatus Omnitrophota bacterium]|nr:alpha-1,4-glucan--maltose-1-phosphate maltosyltransferase [Candidatus Omnitrophota bacterium]
MNTKRVIIERVKPEIDGGAFPIKRVVGERVVVSADILADGHDALAAVLLVRIPLHKSWKGIPMRFLGNDVWEAAFTVNELGVYQYSVLAHIDRVGTWQNDLRKKFEAHQDIRVELAVGRGLLKSISAQAIEKDRKILKSCIETMQDGDIGQAVARCLENDITRISQRYIEEKEKVAYGKELAVIVERAEAGFSAWYEIFPRSCGRGAAQPGTFKDCIALLGQISQMGFSVLYLPPIHPIGRTNRKGKNNSPSCLPEDPGSPWAIGSMSGGHTSIEPSLGTMKDFEMLVREAKKAGLEIAMDFALQCSPDHPYIQEHPEWFTKRPDGSIQYAENPPKKYDDIVPFNFGTKNTGELWRELKSIVMFWVQKGVRIFRVDNPHTKPFAFWEWLIREVKNDHPEVIFLAEAFTRPKVMYHLAKAGFSQSYTYFTWRNTKREFVEYLTELTQTEIGEYFRPHFWPNTPDILPEHLQYGGRPAFIARFILAATLSSNYGIYGPAFELCVSEALPGKEEYLNSEKYEIKQWERDTEGSLQDIIAIVNRIRKENPALQTTRNVKFCEVDNDNLLFYMKATDDCSNVLLIVVNLDPYHTQSGWVRVPIAELGIDSQQQYLVVDLLSQDRYFWTGERNFVQLDPAAMPAHILRLHRRLRRETDFDYYL